MKNKLLAAFLVMLSTYAEAQFSLSAQLRTRAELRDGQGAPLRRNFKPAAFLSQRTRVNGLFTAHRVKLGLTVQDVRVWGQDVSQINRTTVQDNNGVMFHQAWAEVLLSDTADKKSSFTLKIGRQELVYDDQRLIGNLDWLQQGRRHDAVLLKFETNHWAIHIAGAYNQNRENAAGTIYNNSSPGNYPSSTNGTPMYKSMQFVHASNKRDARQLSFLFFSDQFNKFQMDTAALKSYVPGVWSRFTAGLYYTDRVAQLEWTLSGYYQFGKNYSGGKTDAALASASFLYGRKWSGGLGMDYTGQNFDPLYGTPHKFWGLMDYFYAGSSFGNGGLTDVYFKTKYKPSGRLMITGDVHHFASVRRVAGFGQKRFGEEVDLVANYALTNTVSIEGGYSHFFSTALLASPAVKNVPDARNSANWCYVMVTVGVK